jgi:predicted GIY-YIG superfamily endonuclease
MYSRHPMFVYLLQCTDGSTYVGATVDLTRRLRQHNGEIKGGAKRTTSKLSNDKTWTRICYVSQFPDWTATLQFEWRWKQISRKYPSKMLPLDRRMRALHDLLSLCQSTSKAIPYEEWIHCPIVHIERNMETCSIFLDPESYEIAIDDVPT